jgi:HAE1 family hydrophobic/amphiphilic exporter-1
MTSIAFILGVVPLLTASGAGAAARVSIGITVFSGMIASTCLAVALVPVFFVQIQNMTLKRQSKREQQALSESVTEQPKE